MRFQRLFAVHTVNTMAVKSVETMPSYGRVQDHTTMPLSTGIYVKSVIVYL